MAGHRVIERNSHPRQSGAQRTARRPAAGREAKPLGQPLAAATANTSKPHLADVLGTCNTARSWQPPAVSHSASDPRPISPGRIITNPLPAQPAPPGRGWECPMTASSNPGVAASSRNGVRPDSAPRRFRFTWPVHGRRWNRQPRLEFPVLHPRLRSVSALPLCYACQLSRFRVGRPSCRAHSPPPPGLGASLAPRAASSSFSDCTYVIVAPAEW